LKFRQHKTILLDWRETTRWTCDRD
jgi:hypothetical protein